MGHLNVKKQLIYLNWSLLVYSNEKMNIESGNIDMDPVLHGIHRRNQFQVKCSKILGSVTFMIAWGLEVSEMPYLCTNTLSNA